MTHPLVVVSVWIGSYLLGGIPFGFIAGRLRGIDLRQAGSGNIGATNVARVLGRRWGMGVFVLDSLKGFISALGAGRIFAAGAAQGSHDSALTVVWLFAAFCAVLGHNFSPFLGFRGGKGVSTSFGAALGIFPHLTIPAVVALVVWGIFALLTRMSSVASIGASVALPVSYLVLALNRDGAVVRRWPFVTFTLLLAAFAVIRHRANLSRILAGTEARIGRGETTDAGPSAR